MSTTALGRTPTPRHKSSVARVAYQPADTPKHPSQDVGYVRAVVAAIGQCNVRAGGWRRKDVLRGRPNPISGLFKLLRELQTYGASPPELEGINVALSVAVRAIALEGLQSVNRTFDEYWEREQRCEGVENLVAIQARSHASPGTYRAFAAALIEENGAQQEFIDWLISEALRMEAQS
jgi:hypothetical protein